VRRWSLLSVAVLALAALAAPALGAAPGGGAEAPAGRFIGPGREGDVLALLRPYGLRACEDMPRLLRAPLHPRRRRQPAAHGLEVPRYAFGRD
jgi:hypothetical protein